MALPALSLVRNPDGASSAPSRADTERELRLRLDKVVNAVVAASHRENLSFKEFEHILRDEVFSVARAAIAVFLTLVEERVAPLTPVRTVRGSKTFRRAPSQPRSLATMFGVVRYSRTYLRDVATEDRRGFHPLDVELGLTADRISMNVLSTAARLATKMSFAEAKATTSLFVPQAPSTEVIEKTVLGLGHYSEEWFATRPAPSGDGEVLIVMIDSKGAPTATEQELAHRRGKRCAATKAPSSRHRGRFRRRRHPRKPRRKQGDNTKNARMATMVIMYTLKQQGNLLLGPINKWTYASFAPKEHAFEVARREADKRGFAEGSGKVVQFVSDGDNDLAHHAAQYFPSALHTIDVMHVLEKIWNIGESIHRSGTPEHRAWVAAQKRRLFSGKARAIVDELRRHLTSTAKTGPGNKGKRERLNEVIGYLEKRVDKMDFGELVRRDLETATGVIEGAIKNVIGKRCDHGGMRWIKERAEAVVQLRCIELNGDWNTFIDDVHAANQRAGREFGERRRLQKDVPRALPEYREYRKLRRRQIAARDREARRDAPEIRRANR